MKSALNRSSQSGFRWRWVLFAALILVGLAAARHFRLADRLDLVLNWGGDLGAWGPVMFVGLYVVAAVLLIPGSALTLGAGAVFGVGHGLLLASVASTLAATAAFLVGRYLARNTVRRRIDTHPKFTAIDRAVGEQGWKIVLLTRLSPAFPYTLLNYAFGLTRVKLGPYVLASWIGMLPGTLMYVYLGSLARVVGERVRTPAEWVLYGVGLLATVAVTLFVTRLARKAMAERVQDPAEPSQPKTNRQGSPARPGESPGRQPLPPHGQ